MKISKASIAAVLLLVMASSALPAESKTQAQVRVFFDSPERLVDLRSMHLDEVWVAPGYIEIIADSGGIARLNTLGYKTEIVHDDICAFYSSRIPEGAKAGWKTLSQIEAELFFMHYLYPSIVSDKISIGQTIEGRDIYAVKISDNVDTDEDEPEILYTAAIHAREAITPEVLLYFMNYLTQNYGVDPEVTDLVDNLEMWFVLVVNPDGYNYNFENYPSGGGMWRKNRRDNGNGTWGVDINRNFGYMWGYDDIGSSPNSGEEDYRGTGPFSEPESQVMRDFALAHDFVITLYYHSYSNLILYPWSYERGLFTPDDHIFSSIGNTLNSFNGYTRGPGWILYPTNGDSDDWGYGEQTLKNKNFSFTVEVGSYDDGFWPELNRIQPLVEENLQGNLYLAWAAENINAALPPESPLVTTPDSIGSGESYDVVWSLDDTLNPAVYYQLQELEDRAIVLDSANDFDNWYNHGFMQITYMYHSGGKSFFSGDPSTTERYIQSLYPYEVQPNDTLKFWTNYDISPYWDYAYVEVSTDGFNFWPIPGNITTNVNHYNHNRGNGITESSYAWVQGLFDLSAYVGEEIYIRFSYVDHSLYYAWWGIAIDDIYPAVSFGAVTTVSSTLTDTSYTVEDNPLGLYYYRVRAQDADSQWSAYSSMATTVVGTSLPYLCGDANGDADYTIADCLYLLNYIFGGGPAPEYFGQGDADNCGSINTSDVVYLMNYVFMGGPAPCAGGIECYQPPDGYSVYLGGPVEIITPTSDDSVAIPIHISSAGTLHGFSLGFSHNSPNAEFSSVSLAGSVLTDPTLFETTFDPANNRVLIGYSILPGNSIPPQDSGLLATLWMNIPAGTPPQNIDIDSFFVPPAGEFIFSPAGGGSIVPYYVDAGAADIIVSAAFICGDANNNEAVNILDITYIINYVYKGGPQPDPLEAADVNSDFTVNLLDITYLISYLYKGGPAPYCP
jgi:hypothetical protein